MTLGPENDRGLYVCGHITDVRVTMLCMMNGDSNLPAVLDSIFDTLTAVPIRPNKKCCMMSQTRAITPAVSSYNTNKQITCLQNINT